MKDSKQEIPDIIQSVVIKASIQKVWEAVSTSEGIAAWFMPNDFQRSLGHEFTIQTPFGTSHCKVVELDAPTRLTFTWGEQWHVSFALEELNNVTKFTLVHSGWSDQVNQETGEENAVIRDRMNQGWVGIVEKLRNLVEA